jgi:hypothetical protein
VIAEKKRLRQMTLKCPQCKHVNPNGSNFCEECGAKLRGAAPPVARPRRPLKCPHCKYDNLADSVFCENCGAKLPAVAPPKKPVAKIPEVLYELSLDGKSIRVHEDSKTFGRQDFIELIPESKYKFISRKHFTIFRKGGKFYIRDEGSANGTKLNGAEIKGAGKKELKAGDTITIAEVVEVRFNLPKRHDHPFVELCLS